MVQIYKILNRINGTTGGKLRKGLIPVKNKTLYSDLSIGEQASLTIAASFDAIDYLFFRQFEDGRSSQVAACIVDNTDEHLSEHALSELHHRLWMYGSIPLIYVAWPTQIDILSCVKEPIFWNKKTDSVQYSPEKKMVLEDLSISSEISAELERFSFNRLADGTFWEQELNKPLFDRKQTAHELLIKAVEETDKYLEGENNSGLRRLLILFILIKYLEDRDVFPGEGWFGRFCKGARSFYDIVAGQNPQEVLSFLRFLEGKFNGDIFAFNYQALKTEDLEHFAFLIESKTLNQHRYLWKQFSFEHIPVEIISNLYQRFVSGNGAVYTPPFLASLLLDYAMPYSSLTGKERVLDPSCGSGVFLVGAFKRLVNVWRAQNEWKRPDVTTLKNIMKQSIFGIELKKTALDLTSFSLALSICDALRPDVIWKDLRFDKLYEENLFEGDFFVHKMNALEGKNSILSNSFDIIIGNPPFESKLPQIGIQIDKNLSVQNKERPGVPDKQAAYFFLECTLDNVTEKGVVCLIEPAGFLYNSNTFNYRKYLFGKNTLSAVYDFVSIRNLFDGADKNAVALLVKKNTKKDAVTHCTFRRTASVYERICFELDHYDYHTMPYHITMNDPFSWRINLLGGGRLHALSGRFRELPTLKEYVAKKDGWDYGEGFIAAKSGKRSAAKFLNGKPFLPTAAFTTKGIKKNLIGKVEETRFRSAYTEKRYSSPMILIKEGDSLPMVFWDEGFLAYKHKIVGIHAPEKQKEVLKRIHDNLLNNIHLYKCMCALHGSQALAGKATAILKQDIDKLPIAEKAEDLQLSFWEKALENDVLEYMQEYVRIGQNSDLLLKVADKTVLQGYAELFIRMITCIYENIKSSEPVFINGLVCQPFYFGEKPALDWLSKEPAKELRTLIYKEDLHKNLRTIRILRYYTENVILIIKPDRLRYWIGSTAIRDADETLVDLRKQGY